MEFSHAQADMRIAYYGGGPGVFVSGVVWILAGVVSLLVSKQSGMITFFFAGTVIFPLSMLLSKALKRSGRHDPSNPLGALSLESTALLFVGLFIAFVVAFIKVELFFPIMLLIIGGRYLTFSTLYGMRVYWILGGVLAVIGVLLALIGAGFAAGAFAGGLTEVLFSFLIAYRSRLVAVPNM